MIILELLDHMALLTALVVISGFIGNRLNVRRFNAPLQGLLFGLVTVIGMLRPLTLIPGLFFDGRSVIISLCAVFFGPTAALTAGLIALAARTIQGGIGLQTGALVIITSVLIGTFFHYRNRNADAGVSTLHLVLFGLAVHAAMLVMMLTLPGGIGMDVIRQVALPVLLVYPVMTVLIGRFLSEQIIRQKEQRELNESEERFRQLVEMGPDAIFVHTDYRIAYLNQAAVKLLGGSSREMLIGHPAVNWTHPDAQGVIQERIRLLYEEQQPVPTMETKYIKLDGNEVDVEATAVPIRYQQKNGALVYVRDITDRKRQEQEKHERLDRQRQQQKLESIGTLASGVAHEINNPIMGIINYAQLIIDDVPEKTTVSTYAQEILTESERVTNIVRDLLRFSRIEKREPAVANPAEIIQHAISLVNTAMRKDAITVKLNIEDNLPSVCCRSQRILQVLVNLLTNARDALNEKYPEPHENKIMQMNCHNLKKDGRNWIRIEVEDHGNGIPEAVRQNLFDPFFTTKPKDLGTGLGLAVSYGIIEEHRGRLHFETEQGVYAKFIVDLPVECTWKEEEIA